jgi:hypothetical protein
MIATVGSDDVWSAGICEGGIVTPASLYAHAQRSSVYRPAPAWRSAARRMRDIASP